MYIKQIVIENFRSFKGHHVIGGLHPGHNAIAEEMLAKKFRLTFSPKAIDYQVGRNGSGKSSLLESISFVLSDRYYPITKEQRISVINDNPINHTRSASVEIIFCNEDNVLAVDAPEVRIRRLISLGFDRFTLNNEKLDPSDLFQLLEPVFSKESPYYIVRSDEVARLATGDDSIRFTAISTAIGVHRFNEGIASLLSEIAKKSERIEVLQQDYETSRESLSSLLSRFNRFHKINKTKRYLEHKLCELNLQELKSELATLSTPYEEELLKAEEAQGAYDSLSLKCSSLSTEISSLQNELDLLENLKRKTTAEDIDLTKEMHTLSLEKAEVREKLEGLESGEIESLEARRQKLVSTISEHEEKLKSLEGELLEAMATRDEASRGLERYEYQLVALFRKKVMIEKLRAGDYDLSEVMPRASQINRTIQEEEEEVAQQEINEATAFAQKAEAERELERLRNQLNEVKLLLRDQRREKEELQKSRGDILERRKELQREADVLRDDIEGLANRIETIKRKLLEVVRGDVLQGIDSVRKVLDDWRQRDDRLDLVNGVKGILLEVFTCRKPSVAFAIEVRAGEQLFHHVVRDRLVIFEVLREMKEKNMRGIVNFIPLGDVEGLDVSYPSENRSDYKPMVMFLEPCEQEFKKAVDFVFGRTVIVKDLGTGIKIANTYNLQAITLHGQQVLGRGKFKGGFRDRTKSRVNLYKKYSDLRDKLDELNSNERRLVYCLQKIDEELLSPMTELQKLDSKIYASEQHISKLQISIAEASRNVELRNDAYFPLKKFLDDGRMRLEESRRELSAAEAEIEELLGTPVDEVETSIQELQRKSSSLEKRMRKATEDIPRLQARLESLRKILSRLQQDREDLEDHAGDFSPDILQERRVFVQQKLERARKALEGVQARLEQINEKIVALTRRLPDVKKSLRELEFQREKARMTWEAVKEDAEALKAKIEEVKTRVNEWEVRLTSLGTIPSIQNSGVFHGLGKKSLEKRIGNMAKEEQRLGSVDLGIKGKMKKLERHVEALEELVALEGERKRRCEEEMARIEAERVEALRVGFERINEFFGEIFGQIVANGRACLYPVEEHGREVEEADWATVAGVRVRATFVGRQQVERMYQLSGGQKTVVALSLIFAVHRFKPAPFYLLDEVDKALDESSRTSVAELIHGLSESAQFFIVTFRRELLMMAEKSLKVTSAHDCSHVEACSKREALQMIARDSEE